LADEPISMSWGTSTKIISEADVVIREGTATFANGEKAFLHQEGIGGPKSSWSRGTASVDAVYKFDDGSGFSLRFVTIWDAVKARAVGFLIEGKGRFAGIKGIATGSGESPGGKTAWTATYELLKQ
jgi:hypothetical protein